MTRDQYLAAVLRLYREAPDTPSRPRRRDWAIAGELYRRGVPLDHLAHAIRLATLRRRLGQPREHQPIRSLAYYRTVLDGLDDDELDPGYVDYIHDAHQRLRLSSEPRPGSQNPAL